MEDTEADRRAVAFHEAGHAAMAFLSGRAVRRVSIVPAEDIGGFVRFPTPRPLRRVTNVELPDGSFVTNPRLETPRRRTRPRMEAELRGLLAGPAAEVIHLGSLEGWPRDPSSHLLYVENAMQFLAHQGQFDDPVNDHAQATELCRYLMGCDHDSAVYATLRGLMWGVVDILAADPVWEGIGALASALLDRGTLSGRSARGIFQMTRLLRVPDSAYLDRVPDYRKRTSRSGGTIGASRHGA